MVLSQMKDKERQNFWDILSSISKLGYDINMWCIIWSFLEHPCICYRCIAYLK